MAEFAIGLDEVNPMCLIGYPSRREDDPILPTWDFLCWSRKKQYSFWPLNNWPSLFKKVEYWPCSFCVFIDLNFISVNKNAKKKLLFSFVGFLHNSRVFWCYS